MMKKQAAERTAILKTIRRLIDRKLLSKAIDTLHQPAIGHECYGVPRGDEMYRILYFRAESYAREHAEAWGVDLVELYAIMPALEHMRHLACAPKLNE
jgi:hypothetical protein